MTWEPTDQELVLRFKSGDLTALAKLDERYRVRIVRLIAQLAKSYEEAEDIYQEAIFKAASHIESFDHRRSFQNWLHRIAKNQCIDAYRRKNGEVVTDDGLLLKLVGNNKDALDQMTDRELQEKIQQAIDALPKRQRAVARLRILEGLEYKEIAQQIGGSVQAAKSLFSVARKTLKAKLQFYLNCLIWPRRILNRAGETATPPPISISGFLSVALHLTVAATLCYLPMGGSNTDQSTGSAVIGVARSNSDNLRPRLRTISHYQKERTVALNLSSQQAASPQEITRIPSLEIPDFPDEPIAPLPFPEAPLSAPEPAAPVGAPASSRSQFGLYMTQHALEQSREKKIPAVLQSIRPTVSRPQEEDAATVPRQIPAAALSVPFAHLEKPTGKTQTRPASTQAELSGVSASFRRLRAFRRAQTLDAYSLAQLRRIARAQGQHPFLISHCRKEHLQTLLDNGWTPVVLLRSLVGGKHLWVITGWDTGADQITLTNPLEAHEIQLSEPAFTTGWLTGNAPSACLLLSTLPLPKPFQLETFQADDSSGLIENSPRVWY